MARSTWRVESQTIGVIVDTSGNVYLEMSYREDPASGGVRMPIPAVVRVDVETGALLDTLRPPSMIEPSQPEVQFQRGPASIVGYINVPFVPQPLWTFSPHGYFVTGDGSRYVVTLHRTGEPVMRIERDLEPVPVGSAERRYHEEHLLSRARRMDPAWRWSASPVPEYKAHFSELFVDASGRVWIRRALPGRVSSTGSSARDATDDSDSEVWEMNSVFDVFAPTGELLGTVDVPPDVRVHYAYGSTVWGVQRDEDDVPSVVRFQLVPAVR